MGVKFEGLPEIQKKLSEMLTAKELKKAKGDALEEGAKVVAKEISQRLESNFGDYATGATVSEIVISKPINKSNDVLVQIGWNGSKERYRLVHLNENGYTRNGVFYGEKLGGYKQIEKSIEASKRKYLETVRKEMSKKL